jgi:hypothetical protein
MADASSKQTSPHADRKKLYILGGLVLLLVGAVYFSSSSAPTPPPAAPAAAAQPGRVRASDLAATKAEGGTARAARPDDLGPLTALEFGPLYPGPLSASVARNPFAYPPPPPVKPPKPPPPPPPPTIQIGEVTPGSVVAGVPRGVTVTVTGSLFPADARVVWNGRQLPTEVVGDSLARVTLSPGDIASPGNVEVKIVSESQPDKLWSASRPFVISPSPTPPFKYVGRIGDQAVLNMEGGKDNRKLVKVGDTIGVGTQWKVLAIQGEEIEVLDIRNEIRKSVALAKKG